MALRDRDLQIQIQLEQRETFIKSLLNVFNEADRNHNGYITWKDFEAHVYDKKVQAFFNHLELGGVDPERLFRMLDWEGTGKVEAKEFVTGCIRLRGGAKTMDVAFFTELIAEEIMMMKSKILETLSQHSKKLDQSQDSIMHEHQHE